MSTEREIAVDYLARVEGEGAMYLKLKGEEVVDLKFKIFEPPRFFEAFLRGRKFSEAPDITARICGICPIAYQTSACNAMESAAGVQTDRRACVICADSSTAASGSRVMPSTSIFLHAPDFLGYDNAIRMAADFPEQVQMGLRLKKIGNQIMALVGGREIHPINIRVGGFYRVPTQEEMKSLVPELEWALEAAVATASWVAGFPFPDFERDYEFVALRHPDEYAIHEGRIVSNRGLDIGVDEWCGLLRGEPCPVVQRPACPAQGRGVLSPRADGPLLAQLRAAHSGRDGGSPKEAGLGPTCTNPFRSIVVRAVEIAFACEEALRLIRGYRRPESPSSSSSPRDVVGHGASEAPRGTLYHRYAVDDEGLITEAHIVPPTSQNQLSIEDDLRAYVVGRTQLSDTQLQWELEQAIRCYDPCISCATHFLDLTVERE